MRNDLFMRNQKRSLRPLLAPHIADDRQGRIGDINHLLRRLFGPADHATDDNNVATKLKHHQSAAPVMILDVKQLGAGPAE